MGFKAFSSILAAAGMLAAQQIQFPPSFEKLAELASESVNVSLGPEMVGAGSKFLSEKKDKEAKLKQLTEKLKGVYVRSFEFEKEGMYDQKVLDDLRTQLKSSDWIQIVGTRSKKDGELAEVYTHKSGGLVVLAAEPKELTVVNLVGQIGAADLGDLSGQFGIPKSAGAAESKQPTQKDEE